MDPKKVKTATIITVIVAVLIIALCLCWMLNVNPFQKKASSAKPASSSAGSITTQTDPAATSKPSAPNPKSPSSTKPGNDDLKGASDSLYRPKPENYLDDYVQMLVRVPADGTPVELLYKPEKRVYFSDIIIKLDNNAEVTAIAKENGYTLVLVKEGVAGWVFSANLEEKP